MIIIARIIIEMSKLLLWGLEINQISLQIYLLTPSFMTKKIIYYPYRLGFINNFIIMRNNNQQTSNDYHHNFVL